MGVGGCCFVYSVSLWVICIMGVETGHYFLITLYLKFIFLQFLFCPCPGQSSFFCEATIYNFIMQGNLGVNERYTVKDGCVLFLCNRVYCVFRAMTL